MKWNDYKKGIRTCPDGELHLQYGIYDNFTIPVRESLLEVISQFNKLYYLAEQSPSPHLHFTDSERTVLIALHNKISPLYCGFYEEKDVEREKHAAWQQKNYQASCMFHPHDSCHSGSLWHQLRNLARVCLTLGDTFQSAGMPFCMPRTVWDTEDNPRKIVYWPDADEEEMCGP